MSLPHAILTILAREKSSGYDLARHFALTAGYIWSATHQQIYLELGKLHQSGLVDFTLVSQDGKPDKKVYKLTDDGRDELKVWLKRPAAQKRVRESLLIKVLGSHLVPADNLLEEISRQREEHEQMLSEHRMLLADLGDPDLLAADARAVWLTLRRSVLEREAWLTWAKETAVLFEQSAELEAG